ncbi:MAG TPA: epimerase, partial [Flavisolibacter sp.]|nr:epimerase [Flavisolibacter sp.]
ENDLMKLPFKGEYNFRPGAMLPFPGQKNWNKAYRIIAKILKVIMPGKVLTMKEVGRAMIHAAISGYNKQVLEIHDIRQLAAQG